MTAGANLAPLRVEQLTSNALGRDFVVGDLHGCKALLDRLLSEVRFDGTRDRLFSVGDLIDRGPESMACLELLEQPWFHAVRGNHEEMLLDFFHTYQSTQTISKNHFFEPNLFLPNGGYWSLEFYDPVTETMTSEFDHLLALVDQLPVLIQVGQAESPDFYVVHAELFDEDFDAAALDDQIQRWQGQVLAHSLEADRMLWNRRLFRHRNTLDTPRPPPMVPGVPPVFCGHTIGDGVRRAWSHINLDTGAFFMLQGEECPEHRGLTLMNVATQESWFLSGRPGAVPQFAPPEAQSKLAL